MVGSVGFSIRVSVVGSVGFVHLVAESRRHDANSSNPTEPTTDTSMDNSLHHLLPMFERARAEGSPLVLATVTATRGSTYRKAGAQLLVGPGGKFEGLLSGGCLEGDLAERAASVLETGRPKLVSYENSGEDDLLWGLGSGCEGGMDIWLVRLDAATGWEPFATVADRLERHESVTYGLVLESGTPALPAGSVAWSPGIRPPPPGLPEPITAWIHDQLATHDKPREARIAEFEAPRARMFVATVVPQKELLLLGAGPDALPVVGFAATLGWRVTLVDHRPAYADAARFPGAWRVLAARPGEIAGELDLSHFDAAVIMSHHLATDLAALAALAPAKIPYVGLLGPTARRKRLLADLDPTTAALFDGRLRSPVGLDLGGRDPASIALAIVAEVQAFFNGRGHQGAP